jgi:pyruvate, water dikinase
MHSTGLPSLDEVIRAVLPGDNIVWQVDEIADYEALVAPFCATALQSGHKVVYFRFARHAQLVPDDAKVDIHRLAPEMGFEKFTAEIHKVIAEAGRGTYYVFDCLSDLAADWYSDLMLGNFFMVTCPYLYELETVTYFGLLRDHHSQEAVSAIRDTTQILVDVFRHQQNLYIHPLKVDQRHSPTMYLPHAWDGITFRPVSESAVLSEMLVQISEQRVAAASRTLDVWDRSFVEAREAVGGPPHVAREFFERLLRMMITHDKRIIALASKYLALADLLAIRKRMIGTGLIGGKSVGMLLARTILSKADARWRERLETHDSFFIGSDVFYTFLVRNNCWFSRVRQRSQTSFLEGVEEARQQILSGTFPSFIREQFIPMLEHFGQSPIIVRSSSLLEDSFGNAFTGKYESVFCPNQGSPDERLAAFLDAVRRVYVSTMSEEALLYRAHRGLLDSDEQMGVLVQRVSGAVYGNLFYPQIAGVALSYNPYAWSEYIDPDAGVIRLVFGLGTRAVDRSDDDYTRIVALNAPLRRPEVGGQEVTQYAQHRVDVIDLEAHGCESLQSAQVFDASPGLPIELFASRQVGADHERAGDEPWVLTFDRLLSKTTFVQDMRDMLSVLRNAYNNPVDTEFTANFLSDGSCRINLVQCRPFQVREGGGIVPPPQGLNPEDVVLEGCGTVIGQSVFTAIDRIIYVVPAAYAALPLTDRYAVARLIGRLTHLESAGGQPATLMLLGPGRWGTKTPSLGVPVSFADIAAVSVLCEIVTMGSDIVPDVSLGTHFFNDIVEANMLYMAVYPERRGNRVNEAFFDRQKNRLAELMPDDARMAPVVRVIDLAPAPLGTAMYLNANCVAQQAVGYLAAPPSAKRGGFR